MQVWVALHNGAAFTREQDTAVLSMDLGYITSHANDFDWNVRPLIAAITSLRGL